MKYLYALLLVALLPSLAFSATKEEKKKLAPINHIIVFYLENHSFDNLMGTFPGADGIAYAGDKAVQKDKNGVSYATLPPVKTKTV